MFKHPNQVGGWTINRGYRTVSQTLVDVDRSPGVGVALRELYNRGLGKPRTTRDTLLLQASPEAAKIYNYAKQLGHDHPRAMELVRQGLSRLAEAFR